MDLILNTAIYTLQFPEFTMLLVLQKLSINILIMMKTCSLHSLCILVDHLYLMKSSVTDLIISFLCIFSSFMLTCGGSGSSYAARNAMSLANDNILYIDDLTLYVALLMGPSQNKPHPKGKKGFERLSPENTLYSRISSDDGGVQLPPPPISKSASILRPRSPSFASSTHSITSWSTAGKI